MTATNAPASSPVAAEGQKAALTHEQITKFGLGLEYVHSVLRWAACGYVHTPERIASLHTSYRIVDRIINATPTASMADAADAERFRRMAGVVRCSVKGVMLDDTSGIEQWRSAVDRIATPGPRGENAGGVVEALSDEALLEALTGHVRGYITNTVRLIAMDVQRACATAWGLRIAEKGDAP